MKEELVNLIGLILVDTSLGNITSANLLVKLLHNSRYLRYLLLIDFYM